MDQTHLESLKKLRLYIPVPVPDDDKERYKKYGELHSIITKAMGADTDFEVVVDQGSIKKKIANYPNFPIDINKDKILEKYFGVQKICKGDKLYIKIKKQR